MTLTDVLTSLGIENHVEVLGVEWEKSESTFKKKPRFLEPDFLQTVIAKYFNDRKLQRGIVEAAQRIATNPAAVRLLWHQHYLVAQNYDRFFRLCYKFPELPMLASDARAHYLILALSGAMHAPDFHRREIPTTLLAATISDFKRSIDMSMEHTGMLGLAPHYSGWWQGFFLGKLYRLGRLTFLQEKYEFAAHVFEKFESGELRAYSGAGLRYNKDGLVLLPGDAGGGAWEARFQRGADSVTGNLLRPDGFAVREPETLNLQGWREMVSPGESVLGVHISPGEKMAIEGCAESFQQALAFFEKYFPEMNFKGFVCDSWLLDPNLRRFMLDSSNIVQFQKRYHLLPSPNDHEFVSVRSIFGSEALRLGYEKVPHATQLQKGAAEFKRSGGRLRPGLAVHPWRVWGPIVN